MLNSPARVYQQLFKFVEVVKPTYPLLFYRTGLALICIGKFAVLYHNYLTFYGQYGLIQWSISKVNASPYAPHIGDYSIFLSGLFHISMDDAAMLVMKLFFCSSLLLFFGLFTRLSTIACFTLHLAFINTGSGIIYGVEVFTQLALFYALFFPLNATYSADIALGLSRYKRRSLGAGVAIRLIQFQMCLVYLSSGIEKCMGIQWLNGEAIWRTLMMPIFANYDFSWIAAYPVIPFMAGIAVLLVETGYIVFMWKKNIRVWWLAMIVALHLGIGVFMGMWFFATVMIFLSVFAFGDDVLRDILRHRAKEVSWLKQG